ncbi:MAG TPA: PqqD family protein [Terriglobales bacterium]|nr:PqqD family protein [Terriglobales bacterium]
MMTSETYVRSDSVVSRVIAGETLVVPIRGNVGDLASIYSLNAVGSTIWQALDRPKAVDELAELVEAEYEVSSDQAKQDVSKFLEEMRFNGLVAPMNSTGKTV